LRNKGIAIMWITDSPAPQTGAIRSVLEQAGLDPRGQDVLVLAGPPDSRKQVLRQALAASSCIIAIAGDERSDFDERFRYLRNPAEGARLDLLIGSAWFLIRNIFPPPPSTGSSNP
jgi:predicted secreted acid phosphatase